MLAERLVLKFSPFNGCHPRLFRHGGYTRTSFDTLQGHRIWPNLVRSLVITEGQSRPSSASRVSVYCRQSEIGRRPTARENGGS